jgi:glycosyltransferase involved in cell wall biosynthesis
MSWDDYCHGRSSPHIPPARNTVVLETLPRLTENFEIVFANDGSTDRTGELLNELKAKYKRDADLAMEPCLSRMHSTTFTELGISR